jgi:hypothetical protein
MGPPLRREVVSDHPPSTGEWLCWLSLSLAHSFTLSHLLSLLRAGYHWLTGWLLNRCWLSPAQWLLVPSPLGFMVIFYCLDGSGSLCRSGNCYWPSPASYFCSFQNFYVWLLLFAPLLLTGRFLHATHWLLSTADSDSYPHGRLV